MANTSPPPKRKQLGPAVIGAILGAALGAGSILFASAASAQQVPDCFAAGALGAIFGALLVPGAVRRWRAARRPTAVAVLQAALGVIAVLGMLFAVFGAGLYDGFINSPWGADGLEHNETIELLPYLFWFLVWLGLFLWRRRAAAVLCNWRSLCGCVGGAILGGAPASLIARHVLAAGTSEFLSPLHPLMPLQPAYAEVNVIVSLGVLMGAALGLAMVRSWRRGSH
jgi:hypothetical protein